MESRREFIKKAALLSGAGAAASVFPSSIARAFAIDPAVGTSFRDAEHVVILMQENRSFDHCFGTLNGVRGFNDPRAVTLPNGKPVWLQTNSKGESYPPFRLNIKDTNATWMGSLPHGWTDQVDARNGGRHDQWLEAKRSGHPKYKEMPLTLGYYNREDLPFYYSLADAFTICDQNFCSSLTGTTPNRLHLWTGTVRENAQAPARIRNEETDYGVEAQWKTFPERLEENGISWKIYQNEISVGVGFDGEHDAWLSNFTDNPIEWFSQYQVRFHPAFIRNLPKRLDEITREVNDLENKLKTTNSPEEVQKLTRRRDTLTQEHQRVKNYIATYNEESWKQLSPTQRALHEKAFATNRSDPDYHELASIDYDDDGTRRSMRVPKGDVLFQFRKDVDEGKLPTVSWLVAPENFSDHPGAPWYGAWYLSEAFDILTKNPEVWKKTIFILCYDENDGYFDHVPPFVPPTPGNEKSGRVSKSIDVSQEYVPLEMDLKRKPASSARESAIGLGYRVPLVIASPWTRGGVVNSQVFDHTSILMFLENFLSEKTGKKIMESNISSWRRAVCGDLTSVFQEYRGEKIQLPKPVDRVPFYEGIHRAQFKKLPDVPKPVTEEAWRGGKFVNVSQEPGQRRSSALPYELAAAGNLTKDGKTFNFTFRAEKKRFGNRAAGAPFIVYALGATWASRNYAVAAGEAVSDSWVLGDYFTSAAYHFRIDGPNGFYREFKGASERMVSIDLGINSKGKSPFGELVVNVLDVDGGEVQIVDHSYGQQPMLIKTKKRILTAVPVSVAKSDGWYDFSVRVVGTSIDYRFAGRVETGVEGKTDLNLELGIRN